MNDPFAKKVRAAAVAGWWVVLIAVGFLTLLWLVYLAVMSAHPAWLLTLWGPGVDWPFVQSVWFWIMAAVQVLRLAHGFRCPLVDAVGETVA